MAVRAYSGIGVQLGAEVTKGTTVPANRQLMGLRLDPAVSGEFVTHKPSGFYVPTISSMTSEMTEGDAEGPIDYNSIVYPLSSLFGGVTPVAGGVGDEEAYTWTWNVEGSGSIDPKSFSFEVGDATGAKKFNYGVFTGLDLDIARQGDNTFSAPLVGRDMTSGSMTASPTQVDIVPVNGDHWDVFADDTDTGLGSTKLLALYDCGLSFGDLFQQEWTINSANRAYNSMFLGEDPSFEWEMTLGADAVAEAYLAQARNGGRKFIRLQASGPDIAGTSTAAYSIQIDFAAIVTEFDTYQSSDGSYALPVSMSVSYDPTWGQAMQITVVNGLATL